MMRGCRDGQRGGEHNMPQKNLAWGEGNTTKKGKRERGGCAQARGREKTLLVVVGADRDALDMGRVAVAVSAPAL